MKRFFLLLAAVSLFSTLTACGTAQAGTGVPTAESKPSQTATAENKENQAAQERKLKMIVQGQEVQLTLYDTPTARALYEKLPMELTFSDFNGTEKIAYPPEKLPTDGEPDGCDPEVGDLCLYAPWGNLCIFYQDFRYSKSLIKLGHVDAGMEVLAKQQGDFKVTLEKQ